MEKQMSLKNKIAVFPALILVTGAALYCLNRYWIAPAAAKHEPSSASRPSAPDFTVTDFSGNQVNLSGL